MIARILLFCSSYTPLFVIFGIRFPRTAWIWWPVSALFAMFAVIILCTVLNRHEPQFYRVAALEDNSAAAAYVATYILPFVTITEPSTRDFVAYGVFFLVVAS